MAIESGVAEVTKHRRLNPHHHLLWPSSSSHTSPSSLTQSGPSGFSRSSPPSYVRSRLWRAALGTSRRAADDTIQVKPIMKKHNWTLPLLSEFLPDQSNLLGINVGGGQKILIRLRPNHATDSFLPLDDLIGTMVSWSDLSHLTPSFPWPDAYDL